MCFAVLHTQTYKPLHVRTVLGQSESAEPLRTLTEPLPSNTSWILLNLNCALQFRIRTRKYMPVHLRTVLQYVYCNTATTCTCRA
jgi:hypothetical protein